MTMLFGTLFLALALLASVVGLIAAMAAARLGSRPALSAARLSIVAILLSFTGASIALLHALINSNFEIQYIARFTEKALPLGYKLAAFWAGQEGSLLLWGWLIALFGVIWILVTLRNRDAESAIATGTIAVVCGLFASIMLFCDSNQRGKNANPFHKAAMVAHDGEGLNPMLQDPGMIAHPPLLFAGYAGFTIPFGIMIGALLMKRKDNEWLASTRRWLVTAWLFLTVGILLGAQWAYVELGWGGYWAWDPVENASLLPWLTGTALVHSIMAQQQRGMLKRWNAALIALTFALCIFGTWITRSGIVDSVHSFGQSMIGTFFLVFLVISLVFSAVLIIVRNDTLAGEHELETVLGKEGMFLVTNVLLVIMALVTTIGTLFPAISQAMTGNQVTVKQTFYNNVIVPMGLVLMAMMAVGPLLSFGKDAGNQLSRRLPIPLAGGAVAAIVVGVLGGANAWALMCAFIVGVAIASLFSDLLGAIIRRSRGENENPLLATVRVLDGNHRRYGGQMVHIGMLMLMVGIAGSSVYNVKHELQLSPGQTVKAGDWHVRYDDLKDMRMENYTAVEATLQVTDPSGQTRTLRPQKRFYDKWQEQPNTEVAIWSDLQRDAYAILGGWEEGGKVIGMQLLVNPLMIWLWIGGIVMIFGCLYGLLPRLLPAGATAQASDAAEIPVATLHSGKPATSTN